MMMRKYVCAAFISLALCAVGCMKSDKQVAASVQDKINADGNVPDKQISVNASGGVVTLSGAVSSDAARNAAANDAAHVSGVKTVVNNLQVAPPATAADNDQPAAQAPSEPQMAQSEPQMTGNPAPRVAARPSPRSGRRSRYSPPPDNYSSNSGDNGSGSNSDSELRRSAPSQQTADNSTPPAPVTAPEPQPVTVPVGTEISIRLNDELSSEKAQIGDVFHGSISTPIQVGDVIVIPTTADVEGRVVDVKSAGRFAGQSDLVIQLTRLMMNGKSYPLATDNWSKAGSSRGKATAAKVGGGAAVGAILGGIFGGGKGAAIGAAAGAGAGTGVAGYKKGQQIVLKPETILSFRLQNSISVRPGAGNRQPLSSSPSN